MAELAVLGTFLQAGSGESERGASLASEALREAREAMPAPPALDSLCAIFVLSEFERRIVLLCAGSELDGEFSRRCAAAPGSGGNPWPSFGLALAAIGIVWMQMRKDVGPGKPGIHAKLATARAA